ncbi:MAG: DNA mismatch repair endonuclease MutL, partial [Heliobacteriaceae bacterium]|nr:DNA mismatch repair endonuclease MutL [Heliobacteriaceae bacterium]
DPQGVRIRVEEGHGFLPEPAGLPPGTTILVADLFYNTPARYKFLRAPTTEGAACTEIVWRLALANPGIAFSLQQEKKVSFRSPGNNKPLETLAAIYGPEVVPHLLPVAAQTPENWKISGYIGGPALNRANRQHQTWFVNGRWIRSRPLTLAVEAAFQGTLPIHRFPFYVLHLGLPGDDLDINVHPAKQEIKIFGEQEVSAFVQDAVKNTLQLRPLARPFWSLPPKVEYSAPPETAGGPSATGVTTALPVVREPVVPVAASPAQTRPVAAAEIADWVPIGQFQNTYIVATAGNALMLIDQHAAHERVLFDSYRETWTQANNTGYPSQQLLLPVTLTLAPAEFQAVIDHLAGLGSVGLTLEPFGGRTVLIRSVPVGLPPGEEAGFIRDVVSQLRVTPARNKEALAERIGRMAMTTLACRAAVKAGQRLSHAEMVALLQQLAPLAGTDTCPHGRPYLLRIEQGELERKFHRS